MRLILLLLLLSGHWLHAQQITRLEYFFDSDPGFGNATSVNITPDAENLSGFNFTANTASLSQGAHVLYFRTQDDSARWSQTYRREVEIFSTFETPKVMRGEYFIDTDSGYGLGTSFNFTNGPALDLQTILNVNTNIPIGNHVLYIRTLDSLGRWSQTYRREIEIFRTFETPKVMRGEYCIDVDNGFGLGTPFNFTNGPDFDLQTQLNANPNLTIGNHVIYIRALDSLGHWSQTYRREFEKIDDRPERIVALEYAIDRDTGFGGNFRVTYTIPFEDGTRDLTIPTAALPLGPYIAYIRTLNSKGNWSQTARIPFNNCGNTIPSGPISYNGNSVICGTGNIQLNSPTAPSCTYQWQRDNVNITGATTPTYSATSSGQYTVVVSNSLGCVIETPAVAIVQSNLPPANITAPSNEFCENSSLNLAANANLNYTYQWLLNAVNIPGATDAFYAANQVGSYAVLVTNELGCSSLSSGFNVNVAPAPIAFITQGDSVAFCSGASITLNAVTTPGNSYQWFYGNFAVSGGTTASLIANSAGNYTVEVTDGACSSISAPIYVGLNPSPSTPAIFEASGILNSTAPAGNQWYLNGQAISGATASTFTPTQTGNYTVIVTNSFGCSNGSPVFNYNPSSIGNTRLNTDWFIYPNPSQGVFFLSTSDSFKQGTISIYNTLGALVLQENLNGSASETPQTLHLNVAPGVYYVKVKNNQSESVQKLVMQ